MIKRDLLCHFDLFQDIRKLFKRKSKPSNESNVTKNSGQQKNACFESEICKKLLYDLKHLVSVTQDSYQVLCLDLLDKVAFFIQENLSIEPALFEKILAAQLTFLNTAAGICFPLVLTQKLAINSRMPGR